MTTDIFPTSFSALPPSPNINLFADNGSNGLITVANVLGQLSSLAVPIGSTTPSTGSFTSLNINPTASSTNSGLNIVQSPSGTPGLSTLGQPGFWANQISFTGDDVNAGSSASNALVLSHVWGGPNAFGGRQTFSIVHFQNAATNSANTNRNYVAGVFGAYSVSGDGGTNLTTDSRGAIFGMNPYGTLRTGATNMLAVTAGECNVTVQTGASVKYKAGLTIVQGVGDAVQGSLYDCSLALSSQSGGVGTQNGILLGPMNGIFPITSTGTIMSTINGSCAYGIDFTSTTFSNASLRMPGGFSVSPSGVISVTNASFGGDTGNGRAIIGAVANTGTPHLDWNGLSTTTGVGYNFRMIYDAANTMSYYSSNGAVAKFLDGGSTVANYVTIASSATALNPVIAAVGSDTNVSLTFKSQAAGAIFFQTGSGVGFAVGDLGSTVANWLQFRGAATTSPPSIIASGGDTNIGIKYITKGTGGHFFQSAGGSTIATISSTGLGAFVGLTSTGSLIFQTVSVTSGASYTVLATDYLVIINKGTGSATGVTLPASPATGRVILIKDGKGDAGTNNITVSPAAGTIDGSATAVINVAYGAITFVYSGSFWSIV